MILTVAHLALCKPWRFKTIKVDVGRGGQTSNRTILTSRRSHLGVAPALIFGRKFVEITVQTSLPRDAVPLHTNRPLRGSPVTTNMTEPVWRSVFVCFACKLRLPL
uniref:(northern house mosquito) hypothetical protein n=1 Tax=Culex pipiens TaxID=7175 RepID=A0A8D8AI48_CULPI